MSVTVTEEAITKLSTEDFANLVLSMPDTVYIFTVESDYKNNSCPWYGIVNARIFDVQNIFINKWAIEGGAPFMFDLPDYDENIDYYYTEEQSKDCIKEMINGLDHFSILHGSRIDTWYVKENYDTLEIKYKHN